MITSISPEIMILSTLDTDHLYYSLYNDHLICRNVVKLISGQWTCWSEDRWGKTEPKGAGEGDRDTNIAHVRIMCWVRQRTWICVMAHGLVNHKTRSAPGFYCSWPTSQWAAVTEGELFTCYPIIAASQSGRFNRSCKPFKPYDFRKNHLDVEFGPLLKNVPIKTTSG